MTQEGGVKDGLILMRDSLDDRRRIGASWYQVRYLCMLATTYLQLGETDQGLGVIADAKALAAQNNEHMWDAELARVEGELRHAQGGQADETEACFESALAVARHQSAKSFELRAVTSLARLWREQGRADEARALLVPVYDWFRERLRHTRPACRQGAHRRTFKVSHC